MFRLEAVLTGKEEKEMQSFLRDETKIAEVIRSRDDMSANGIGRISYRVIKGDGAEGVKFVRILWSGGVTSSWKEARTFLLHKKGSPDEIEN
jgi:hypothetical protein